MIRRLLILAFAVATASAATPPGPVVRIEGDRLTIRAERTPILEILREFSHAGVDVIADPALDLIVTGSCRYAPMDEALGELLQHYSYVLSWELVRGPLGEIPRLSEMQVFAPGRRDSARPLDTPRGPLQLTRGPAGGSLFVADEILVAARDGTSVDEFRLLLAQIGGTVVESVPSLGVYRVRLPAGTNIPDLVNQLAANPIIDRVEPNYAQPLGPGVVGASGEAGPVTAPAPGSGATVAVLDSGLMSGLGIEALVKGGFDAMDPTRLISDPVGHGSQMALVASGAVTPDGAETAEAGVPLLAIRAFDDNGVTSNFALMRALEYAAQRGAKVVNLSWGTETDSAFVREAVAYAQSKGLLVVAAAGNAPTGRALYPAALPGVLAVAALGADGEPWDQSNYGEFVALAAPGRAELPVGYSGPPGAYAGTSIASALVARELAQYFGRNPNATAGTARSALLDSLSPGKAASSNAYGKGRLDANAMQRFRAAPAPTR